MDCIGIGVLIEYKFDFVYVLLDWFYGRLSGEWFEYYFYLRGYCFILVIENEMWVVDVVVNEKNEFVYVDYLNG